MPGQFTYSEIRQQPDTWMETAARVRAAGLRDIPPPILTGAGTSYFAALAVEAAWPGARAIPSTDFFLEFPRFLRDGGAVISFARSGDSPESTAVVGKIQRALPAVRHIALTVNPEGRLARWPGVEAVLLDPRANDRSLAMTSSYSNLVLAGLCLARPAEMESAVPAMASAIRQSLSRLEEDARRLAAERPGRVAVLASAPLQGAAREAWLKILEMTAGRIAPLADTYLGFRHGPMSFLEPETLVLCFVSTDPKLRRYETDLLAELRAKKLGRIVEPATAAPGVPDCLRTPADIVFAQLLAYHFSLRLGLDPDNPSPGGVINRVVQGVRIYED